jgi:hypothetical protein
MEEETLIKKFKQWIAATGFELFLWGNDTTEEYYWEEIYQQEKNWKQANHKPL